MNFRNQARVCLIKNCKKAQTMLIICLFQSFRKMGPISYVKGIRLYYIKIYVLGYLLFFSIKLNKKLCIRTKENKYINAK